MKKTKFFMTCALALFVSSGAFAEKGTVYISPNNDGIQDNLEVPLKIKEKRYIKEWSFIVEDEAGNIVRTIGNKENRNPKITFKSFFKQLVTSKTGVAIPEKIVWNGVMDNGDVAPDGTYFYSMTASDDNDNVATTKKLAVVVKNTPPEIELQQLKESDKIFGEGDKQTLSVKQSGSQEDLWLAYFYDAEGKPVRKMEWVESEPLNFEWDGTDDNGMNVPDGVYSYKISATDRAGNKSNPVALTNLIFSAEKPVTNIVINGSRYFSPNDDGILDTMLFDLTVPIPEAKTGNKLVSWKAEIVDSTGAKVFEYSGNETAPDNLTFTGKVDEKRLPDGEYQAVLTAKYLNGYEPPEVRSPKFILDTIPPEAAIVANETTFSPDGDGNQDVIQIAQTFAENKGSPIKMWRGSILNTANNIVVKEIEMSVPNTEYSSTYTWDGTTSVGNMADDSTYRYSVSATDEAGNSATITAQDFALDTSKSEIILAMQYRAFSPNGNGVQDTNKFTPSIKGGSSVKQYTFTIADEAGNVVYTDSKDGNLPSSFVWDGNGFDGQKCPDGNYVANLSTIAENGSEAKVSTQPFVLDTVAPSIDMKLDYNTFSRDGASKKSVLPVASESSEEERWTVNVVESVAKIGAAPNIVKSWSYQGKVPSFEWDGTNEAGNIAPDGTYKILATSTDAAGNSTTVTVDKITLDSREVKAYVTADTDAFSPNNDGFRDSVTMNLKITPTDGISTWSFNIVSPEGTTVRTWNNENTEVLPTTLTWDGLGDDGKVCEGVFSGKLLAVYEKGNEIDRGSSFFISSVTAPDLSVKTAPQYFSPDNDGIDDELYIQLKGSSSVALKSWSFTIKDPNNGKPFWTTTGKSSITPQIIWDGRGMGGELVQSAMDYPYEFIVNDELGLTSTLEGKLSVDVLVIREGNILKMAVPSIIFRSDNADFGVVGSKDANGKEITNGITQVQYDNNERVLKRIAQILKKFKEYTVTVEGHANNITGTEEEETSTAHGNIPLEPLSQQRAEFVVGRLVKYGVDKNRMTAVGRGGRKPVVQRSDKDNWWKNRRVEFILNK